MTILPLTFACLVSVQAQVQPESLPLSPAVVLSQVREVYRAGPVADEITVQVTTDRGKARSASLVVRIDASDAPSPAFRIEFDDASVEPSLVVVCVNGRLIGANTDNENDRWIVTAEGPDLGTILAHLPPIPVPPLQLAFDSDAQFDQPTPYTRDVIWTSAQAPPPQRLPVPASVVLRGRSSVGEVEASFDAATFRFRSFKAALQDGRTLELSARAIPPGDPAAWGLVTEGRREVPSLRDLTPQRGAIPVDNFVPDLSCTNAEGSVWSLHRALGGLTPRPSGDTASGLALILFRTSNDAVALGGAEASAREALRAVRLAAEGNSPIPLQIIAAIDIADYGAHWPALQGRWGAETAQGLAPGFATPSTTIDRFTPDARAAIVFIAPDRRLVWLHSLDGPVDPQALAAELQTVTAAPR